MSVGTTIFTNFYDLLRSRSSWRGSVADVMIQDENTLNRIERDQLEDLLHAGSRAD